MRCAASWLIIGSKALRTSTIARYGAWLSCMSSISVLARCEAAGLISTGPPPGPGLSEMTPWNSSSRSASRSVPRPVSYFSSMTRSGGSRSPGVMPERTMSRTMRCATSMRPWVGGCSVTRRLLPKLIINIIS